MKRDSYSSANTRLEALFVITFLIGVFQLVAGLLRLGRLTRFVSNAVIVGFFSGVGVLIVLGQLSNFTGYQSAGNNKIAHTVDVLMCFEHPVVPNDENL